MLLQSSNAGDIQKYYEGSYVKLQECGDRIFFIHKVNKDGVYFQDSNNDEGVIHLLDQYPYNLNMVLPNKALYQMGQYCYSLARIPARQYSRGITTGNCQIMKLTSDGWGEVGISFAVLQGYMSKPNYRPLAEVVAECKHSEALTDRFAYQAIGKKIWCDNRVVGVVNPLLKTVSCDALLEREVTKLIGLAQDYKVIRL